MKITFEIDNQIMKDQPPDISSVVIEEEATTLTEALDMFERVLKAAGYHFDGHLEIVEDDNEA